MLIGKCKIVDLIFECAVGWPRTQTEEKDKLFDLLNNADELDIVGLNVEDRKNRLTVTIADDSKFEIQVKPPC